MNDVNQPKHYCSHPSGIECIEITEHMNFCLGNAIKYIWRAGLKTDDPLKDLAKAKWYIEREIARLTEEERMDDEYYNAIHRAFGPDGWIQPNAGLKPYDSPKPDSFGRTGNEPLDMSAFVQETPFTDSLYREETVAHVQDELEAARDEALKKACYESMLPEKKPNEWIEHNGGPAPAFKGHVEVYIRDSNGWESEEADTPDVWTGWVPFDWDGAMYRITHYKIKEEN